MFTRSLRDRAAASAGFSAAESLWSSKGPAARTLAPHRKHGIAFTLGRRRLATVELKLAKFTFTLDDILANRTPRAPDLACMDGIRIRSLPTNRRAEVLANYTGMLIGMTNVYRRHYIVMDGPFEDYLSRLSRKTRSTLRRKARRFAEAGGGALDLRAYRGVGGLDEFLRLALPLSGRTYQQRLLNVGLPADPASRRAMQTLAEEDRMRSFLLFLRGRPVSYLYLPVAGRTLIYGHLGYDPAFASPSPGSVLQFAALERLFAEETFAYFDFTGGDGQHKSVFGTDWVRCENLVLLRPTLSNRALIGFHNVFDNLVLGSKRLARMLGAEATLRHLLHV